MIFVEPLRPYTFRNLNPFATDDGPSLASYCHWIGRYSSYTAGADEVNTLSEEDFRVYFNLVQTLFDLVDRLPDERQLRIISDAVEHRLQLISTKAIAILVGISQLEPSACGELLKQARNANSQVRLRVAQGIRPPFPRLVLCELLTERLQDRSAKVRSFVYGKANVLGLKEMLPEMRSRAAVEIDEVVSRAAASAIDHLELGYHLSRRPNDGKWSVSVSVDGGTRSSSFFSRKPSSDELQAAVTKLQSHPLSSNPKRVRWGYERDPISAYEGNVIFALMRSEFRLGS